MNQLRRYICPALHPIGKQFGRVLIRDKTNNTDELVAYTDTTIPQIKQTLREDGFVPMPVSTLKYIETDSRRIYESLSMAQFYDGYTKQFHVYVFDFGKERAVYGHYEDSIFRPWKHQDASNQIPGDPENRLPF